MFLLWLMVVSACLSGTQHSYVERLLANWRARAEPGRLRGGEILPAAFAFASLSGTQHSYVERLLANWRSRGTFPGGSRAEPGRLRGGEILPAAFASTAPPLRLCLCRLCGLSEMIVKESVCMSERMQATGIRAEMLNVLSEKMIPFWLTRSLDAVNGGYLTSFDKDGTFDGNGVKYLVTQSRMIWGFSHLAAYAPQHRAAMEAAARQGYSFLVDKMQDPIHKGYYWVVHQDGTVKDPAKLTYGECFALYALSEYALVYRDSAALNHAQELFGLLQLHAADTLHGGYYENLEADWSPSPAGQAAGDRKSLDIHMHLMEAYTTLYQATGKEIHGRKLKEVIHLLIRHMIHPDKGYGFNQFNLAFDRLPAMDIPRTWNAERAANERIAEPLDTTSFGHNGELSWLMARARAALSIGQPFDIEKKLLDHTLTYGYDSEKGGVYRDGMGNGDVLVTDKEWWQNFEAMVGFLNGYMCFKQPAYWQAFVQTWRFIEEAFLHPIHGESRQLLDRNGVPLVENLGNPWKGIYHTGRALAECIDMLQALL